MVIQLTTRETLRTTGKASVRRWPTLQQPDLNLLIVGTEASESHRSCCRRSTAGLLPGDFDPRWGITIKTNKKGELDFLMTQDFFSLFIDFLISKKC